MGYLLSIGGCYLAALFAPLLWRAWRQSTAWVFCLIATVVFAVFASRSAEAWEATGSVLRVDWIPELNLALGFRLDGLSLFFVLLIAGAGMIMFAYSSAYIGKKERGGYYYGWMMAFMASMVGLVLAENLLLLYLFWELTTLCSYQLIGFHRERPAARSAARQALVVTFAGGLCLLAGIVLLASVAGTLEISTLIEKASSIREDELYPTILVLFLIGAAAKSAQVPFHFWLPDAMEAPAPVSGYLHSAAMVKAGVFLLARMMPVLGETDLWFGSLTAVGAVSMIFAGWTSLLRSDVKQILAYATIAVLGLLVFLLGIGSPEAIRACMTFLLAHALYKAALFLVAGNIDHGAGTRDLDALGGLRKSMPGTAFAAVLAAASMSGLPGTFGFVAKEESVKATLAMPSELIVLTVVLGVTAVFLIAVAGGIAIRPFFSRKTEQISDHETAWILWLSPAVLAVGGMWFGIFPQLAAVLIDNAVSAVTMASHNFEAPSVVPHWNPAGILSMSTLALGAVLYLLQPRLRSAVDATFPARPEPGVLYRNSARRLELAAQAGKGLLQTGVLRHYLLYVLLASAAILAFPVIGRLEVGFSLRSGGLSFEMPFLVAAIVIASLAATLAKSAIACIAAIGMAGYSVALLFAMQGAPDLALTQFIVETLTVVVFALAVYRLPKFSRFSSTRTRLMDGLISVGLAAIICVVLVIASNIQLRDPIAGYYLENAREQVHAKNAVNAILTDYRALDTLVEVTVLATAGAGVFALLRERAGKGRRQ